MKQYETDIRLHMTGGDEFDGGDIVSRGYCLQRSNPTNRAQKPKP